MEYEFLQYASIPVIAALVGWFTNWAAIKLTFYPLEFRGIKPWFGWQGIIPRKAEKMARVATSSVVNRIGSLEELFAEMGPNTLANHAIKQIAPRIQELTDEVFSQSMGDAWLNMPKFVRKRVYQRLENEIPAIVHAVIKDFGENADELVNVQDLVVNSLGSDKRLLNELFLRCGEEEFKFLINSGLHFGFAFGIVQMFVWMAYPAWWILPIFGLFVGYATNWLALNLIFKPVHPKQVGPYTFQGLFLRRQSHVSKVWSEIVTREILTMEKVLSHMAEGAASSERMKSIMSRHADDFVERVLKGMKIPAFAALGPARIEQAKRLLTERMLTLPNRMYSDEVFNQQRSQPVRQVIRDRMEQLTTEQYQDLLRPAFQEDEILLVLIGAGLGALAGFMQLVLIFGW